MASTPIRRRPTTSATKQVKPVQTRPAHHVEQGVARVSGEMKKGGAILGGKSIERILEDRLFGPGEQAAFVRVGAGLTIPTGDYSSLRLDVSITLPCLPSEVELTYEVASDKVQEMISEEESRWLGDVQPKKGR